DDTQPATGDPSIVPSRSREVDEAVTRRGRSTGRPGRCSKQATDRLMNLHNDEMERDMTRIGDVSRAALILGAALSLAGCRAAAQASPAGTPPPPTVTVAAAQQRTIND